MLAKSSRVLLKSQSCSPRARTLIETSTTCRKKIKICWTPSTLASSLECEINAMQHLDGIYRDETQLAPPRAGYLLCHSPSLHHPTKARFYVLCIIRAEPARLVFFAFGRSEQKQGKQTDDPFGIMLLLVSMLVSLSIVRGQVLLSKRCFSR